ncbi:MAG: SHOCT domain-containing protein [Nanoarchaeota archaeon]|nr:SHOCT domain-containing protein [Nanoarchaeota archaeon]MBU1622582.1 SHOCT domain-containing protein [Nanoarchaeota archaeon]MBU1974359.1 SHOCT domain-containing protein [Nanoarchaeota archaeon]
MSMMKKMLLLIVTVVSAQIVFADTGQYMGPGMMFNYGGGYWWIFWIIALIFWLSVIIGIILLIIWLYRKLSENKSTSLEILKKRYASGEINKKKFEEMRKGLK